MRSFPFVPAALVAACLLPACGGRIASDVDAAFHDGGALVPDVGSGSGGGSSTSRGEPGRDAASGRDAGGSCGQPSTPTYDCSAARDADAECTAYGVDGGAATYAQGCEVTTTECDTSFGGPLQCSCQLFPGRDGGPVWVCAI